MKNKITKLITGLLFAIAFVIMPSTTAKAAVTVNGAIYNDSMTILDSVTDKSITSFTIPSTVSQVSSYAFSDCTNLNTLTVQSQVKFMGSLGENLISLKSLELPIGCGGNPVTGTYIEKVTITGDGCSLDEKYSLNFKDCQYLKEIIFNGNQYLGSSTGESSFYADAAKISNCPNLKSFTIPNGIQYVSYYYTMLFANQKDMTIYYNGSNIKFTNIYGLSRYPYDAATCANMTFVDTSTPTIKVGQPNSSTGIYVGYSVNPQTLCMVSCTGYTLEVVSQTSSDPSVLSNAGVGLKAGTAKLTTKYKAAYSYLSVTTGTITVENEPVEEEAPEDYNPSLVKSSGTVKKSGKLQIEVNDAYGKTTYSSSDKSIATVSSSGKVTGKKIGKTTIVVKNNGKTMKFKITVKADPKINTGDTVLGKGQNFKLKVTNNDSKTIKYSSSNKKVATISADGKITARKKGTTTISTKVDGVTVKIKVNVVNASLNKTKATIKKNKTFTLNLKNMPTTTKITWTSSNKKIATVSKKGVIKGVKKGTTTIKGVCNGKTYTCKVTIK